MVTSKRILGLLLSTLSILIFILPCSLKADSEILAEAQSIKIERGARQKIVFLSSLNTQNLSSGLRRNYRSYVPELESYFSSQFRDSRYVIEMKSNADQFDLWHTLHDPQNVAVFWLSHAGSSQETERESNHLFQTHQIVDAQGYDLSPLFQKIHPNLKFLAVIGCFSKNVLNTIPQISHDPKHPDHPLLRVFSYNHKIDAKKGLRQAIAAAKKILTIPEIQFGYPAPCPPLPGFRVQVTREFPPLPTLSPSARLMAIARISEALPEVIGVFPPRHQNEDHQEKSFFIPIREPTDLHSLPMIHQGLPQRLPQLNLHVGDNAHLKNDPHLSRLLNLGDLNFNLAAPPWSLWRDRRGRPIGIESHSYLVESALNSENSFLPITEEPEYSCDPMPPYS